jgi:hypothetical protein
MENKKVWNVEVTASATVCLSSRFYAESEEDARKFFAEELIEKWYNIQECHLPDVKIIEYPILHHDFEMEDIQCEEEEVTVENQ